MLAMRSAGIFHAGLIELYTTLKKLATVSYYSISSIHFWRDFE